MNPEEQRKQRTAVQRLEADFVRTKDDLTLLLEQGLRAQHHAHQQLVKQHEAVIAKQNKELQSISASITAAYAEAFKTVRNQSLEDTKVLRRGFWGRQRWIWLGQ